MKSMNKIIG